VNYVNYNRHLIKGIAIGFMAALFVYMGSVWYNAAFNPSRNSVNVNKKVSEMIYYLERYHVDGINEDELIEGAFEGVANSVGDRYTSYFTQKQYRNFLETMSGKYAGIGVYVYSSHDDNLITVSASIKNSPGEKAGFISGDKIIKVDGVSVTGDKINEAVGMLKGRAGSSVIVTVFRESSNETFDITLTRENINIPTVDAKLLDDKVGYIKITSFDDNTARQFKAALLALKDEGMEALIIDVRNNLGGYLNRVVEICDMLLPEGTIVYREDKRGGRRYEKSTPNRLFDGSMAVLINPSSASASEILAGALKDNNAAVLVGETTFGKGLVQQVFTLSDGSAVKVTVEKYFTPAGLSIDGVGIAPDFEVIPLDIAAAEMADDERDIQLETAHRLLKGDGAES
jgi:carboxyl-terminal processing protease